jgi:hypothetical protein
MWRRTGGTRRSTAVTLGVVTTISGVGCSYFFVTPPRSGPNAAENYSCTESEAAPVVDVALALLQLVGAGFELKSSNQFKTPEVGFALSLSILHIGSARYGFRATQECTEMKSTAEAEHFRRSTVPQAAPQGFVVPPPREPPRVPQPLPPPFDRPGLSAIPASEETPDAGPPEVAPANHMPAVRQRTDDE